VRGAGMLCAEPITAIETNAVTLFSFIMASRRIRPRTCTTAQSAYTSKYGQPFNL